MILMHGIYMVELRVKTKKSFQEQLIAQGYTPEIVAKALAKAERWMRKAFGSVDWNEIELSTIEAYCNETNKKPEGKRTFNRGF